MSSEKKDWIHGSGSVILAIFLWGILPLYWKQLGRVPADQILANRVLWSFVFVFLILIFQGRLRALYQQIRSRQSIVLFTSGFIISLNWFTYIYAVNSDQIIEASLGYYINPLLTILLGRVVLKEKLSPMQFAAVLLAAAGVGIMTFSYGRIPMIALVLALTFSSYSLVKKRISTEVTMGLTIETMAVVPVALCYLLIQHSHGKLVYSSLNITEMALILGTGIITAIPLLLFSYGARKIPLTTLGFIQYLAPTISLFLGIFLYKEPFTTIHFLTFMLIWTALILYSFSQIRLYSHQRKYYRM